MREDTENQALLAVAERIDAKGLLRAQKQRRKDIREDAMTYKKQYLASIQPEIECLLREVAVKVAILRRKQSKELKVARKKELAVISARKENELSCADEEVSVLFADRRIDLLREGTLPAYIAAYDQETTRIPVPDQKIRMGDFKPAKAGSSILKGTEKTEEL
jgi:hypothetical protein